MLHTKVPQDVYGSRLAHGVFEATRPDGKRIAKCRFACSYAARIPSLAHSSTADRRRTAADAHSALRQRYPALIECMSKRNFQFRRLRPILRSHAVASTAIDT